MIGTFLDLFRGLSTAWPGGILSSPAAAAALLSPAAQLVMAAVKTYCSKQLQQHNTETQLYDDLGLVIQVAQVLVQLDYLHGTLSVAQWQQQTQLLQSPAFKQLALMMLAVHSQRMQLAAANSSSSSSGSDGSSSGGGGGSSSSCVSCTPPQQQWHLQLWQELKLPGQLLDDACAAVSTTDPSISFDDAARTVLGCSKMLHDAACEASPHYYKELLPEELSPLQLQLAVQFRLVPLVLISTAAAAVAATGAVNSDRLRSKLWIVVETCAEFAGDVAESWRLVELQHGRAAAATSTSSGSSSSSSSEVPAHPPWQELLQLTGNLAQQVMRQPNGCSSCSCILCGCSTTSSSSNSSSDTSPSSINSGSSSSCGKQASLREIGKLLSHLAAIPCVPQYKDHRTRCWQAAAHGVAAAYEAFIRSMPAATPQEQGQQLRDASLSAFFWDPEEDQPGPLTSAIAMKVQQNLTASAAQQKQLFALLISNIKLARFVALKMTAAGALTLQQDAAAVAVGMAAVLSSDNVYSEYMHRTLSMAVAVAGSVLIALNNIQIANQNSSSSSSSSAGREDVTALQLQLQQAVAPWLVLSARCLEFAAWLLQQQLQWHPSTAAAAAAAASSQPEGQRPEAAVALEALMQRIKTAVIAVANIWICLPMWVHNEQGNMGHRQMLAQQGASLQGEKQQQEPQKRSATAKAAAAAAAAVGLEPEDLDSLMEQVERTNSALHHATKEINKLVPDSGLLRATSRCSSRRRHIFDRLGEQLLQLQQSSTLQQLPQQLQELAAGMSAQLPVRFCCNNPACMNLSQASELVLVGGKSCICGGCTVARYCSSECQAAHWSQHKPVCKRVKAAVAAWQQPAAEQQQQQ